MKASPYGPKAFGPYVDHVDCQTLCLMRPLLWLCLAAAERVHLEEEVWTAPPGIFFFKRKNNLLIFVGSWLPSLHHGFPGHQYHETGCFVHGLPDVCLNLLLVLSREGLSGFVFSCRITGVPGSKVTGPDPSKGQPKGVSSITSCSSMFEQGLARCPCLRYHSSYASESIDDWQQLPRPGGNKQRGTVVLYGSGSKPCTLGEHQNRLQMDVHPPQNEAICFDPWACL